MQILPFYCELPNGIHARPASAIEQKQLVFNQIFYFLIKANYAKPMQKCFALVGADVAVGDECYFTISGDDENLAYEN